MPENFWMALLIAGIVLFVLYAVLISFYHRWWRRLPESPNVSTDLNPAIKLSVIVPARNEEKELPALLAALKEQTYLKDQYEVIVVDDESTDDTAGVVKRMGAGNVRLLPIRGGSKKKAIEAGVAAAIGELILTTDADCIPPPNWLLSMADFYRETRAAFIAAPVMYQPRKTLLHYFQTVDFLTLQGITAGSVSSGFHSMCNGANLAYQRSAFFAVNGFEGIDHVASGDDMLLMHKIKKAFPGKVRYNKAFDAIVSTSPMLTWKDLFWQRMRWASKSTHYGDPRIFLSLLLVYLVNLYFIILLIAGFWNPMYWSLAVTAWLVKFAIELPFVYDVAKFYSQRYLIGWLFLLQPLHILYVVIIGLFSQFGTYYWKGRKLK